MNQAFEITGRLPGLNEYTDACRAHKMRGHAMKKENQEAVVWSIKGARLKPHDGRVFIRYTFYEKPHPRNGAMRDKSNIAAFAVKVIEDALQEAGIIKNDDWRYMDGYECRFFRSARARIVVEVFDA